MRSIIQCLKDKLFVFVKSCVIYLYSVIQNILPFQNNKVSLSMDFLLKGKSFFWNLM